MKTEVRYVRGKYFTKSTDTVVLSSAHAEIIGLSEACRHLSWTRNLLKDLGFKLNPTVMYENNAAAISIATRAYLTSRTRHIHLRDLYTRELAKNGDVKVRYVKTNENIADFFTKFQPFATFRIQRDILMGICPVKRAWTSASCFVRDDTYVATTSSSFPSARSEWDCQI